MVRPGAARTQALEVTEENPLGLTVDAIPDDVNSLNGFNEVCCVCSPLTIFSPVPPPPHRCWRVACGRISFAAARLLCGPLSVIWCAGKARK